MTATAHARATYVPAPRTERRGRGLCLSGGGFRAALFHLGALRRLNELGVLSRLDTISSVSGGSILAAFLADRLRPWPDLATVAPDWDQRVAHPFHAFVAKNLRTDPILKRLLPWNWFRSATGVMALAHRYEDEITDMTLNALPDHPEFIFCATDMAFGVPWIFAKARVGDALAGFIRPAPAWPVARAVAASSCFPPVFNPMKIRLRATDLLDGEFPPGRERDAILKDLRLTDGGTIDNLGLEPVWRSHAEVLVSDGGETFNYEPDRNLLWRLSRYISIQGNQSVQLRKRWLMSNFLSGELRGAYWGVGSPCVNYGADAPAGYSKALVEEVIARVRTDMDAFSEAERFVLENHGYLICEAAIRTHAADLMSPARRELFVPHPEWMDESRVREALGGSRRRRLPLGRW